MLSQERASFLLYSDFLIMAKKLYHDGFVLLALSDDPICWERRRLNVIMLGEGSGCGVLRLLVEEAVDVVA